MKWIDFLSAFVDQPLFHSSMLRIFPEPDDYIHVQLSRWVKTGKLIQIRRGWYLIAEPFRSSRVSPAVIANTVVLPSYLSLEWALSFHGLIPEETPNPTSVTTARAKDFRATGHLFIYRHIKPEYFLGFSKIVYGQKHILIAFPEKALWDKLYLYLRGHRFSVDWLKGLRLQNLEEFDLSKWYEYSMLTSLPSLRRASSLVRDYIKEVLR
jgi:predicted transcriptional regulator of viral defense system